MTDGTAQGDRLPEALEDGYFAPDETSLADLITLLARMAGNLRFDPPRGSRVPVPEGGTGSGRADWADLFSDEPVLVLAEIASLRVPAERARLLRARDPKGLRRVVAHLGEQLLHWQRALARQRRPELAEIRRTLDAAVLQLSDLWSVDARAAGPGGFVPEWRPFPALRRGDGVVLSPLPEATGADALRALAHAGDRILGVVDQIQADCRRLLGEALRTGRHEPALALALAFLQLFQRAQEQLNEFPRRRLEFYYLDVLGFQARPRVPDHAFLALAPAPGVQELVVPEGTRFSAGRGPDNRDVVFVSDMDVRVSDARVETVRALFFARDGLVSPERELGFVTGVETVRADVPPPGEEGSDPTPLFDRAANSPSGTGSAAKLGFAVASPALLLQEGTRTVEMEFHLRAPTGPPPAPERGADPLRDEASLFRELGEAFALELLSAEVADRDEARRRADLLDRATRALGEDHPSSEVIRDLFQRDRHAVFRDLFRRALQVSLSSEAGWLDVPSPFVGPLARGTGLRVVLELGPGLGPVVPYEAEVHGPGYRTQLPVARFRINRDAPFFPYSLLRALELARVEIRTTVRGMTNLVAYNRLGPLDPGRPFQPFGPIPDLESSVAVGSYEAARKRLEKAWLEIEWSGLPPDPGGWSTHYRGYDADYSGSPFRVEIAVARERRWQPLDPEARPVAPLFRREAEDRLGRTARVDLPVLAHFEPVPASVTEESFRRDPRGRNGMFRLSLSPSRVDFGHQAYPQVLTRAVQANARRKRPEAQPRAPYTPVIERLTFNYVAHASVGVGSAAGAGDDDARGKVFHDHPFGSFDLTTAFTDERFALVPGGPQAQGPTSTAPGEGGERDGCVFFGLAASRPPGRLSLVVRMIRSAAVAPVTPERLEWYYLASNRWRRLSPLQVVDDSTHGLQRTGLVTLEIPGDIDGENTILPGGLYWLAATADGLEHVARRIQTVSSGGVRVVWDARESDRTDPGIPIPAGTIQGPVDRVPGLGEVAQVGPSSGGRPAEDFERLATRASERLRHKSRAVSPWDYERLVLERFPEISKVKCYANMDVARHPREARGSVLLVAVPRLVRPEDGKEWIPEVFSGLELEEIRRELAGLASAAARVSVVNPVWESILVRCRVKLRDGARRGRRLDEINRSLVDFLAPWTPSGRGGRFGWEVGEKEVAALLYGLPFVDFVTELSLLHVSEDKDRPGSFFRRDTATTFEEPAEPRVSQGVRRRREDGSGAPWDRDASPLDRRIGARYPWSLAAPRPTHVVQALPEVESREPRITGVGKLEVGRDFILEPNGE